MNWLNGWNDDLPVQHTKARLRELLDTNGACDTFSILTSDFSRFVAPPFNPFTGERC